MFDTIIGREVELSRIERLLASDEPGLAALVIEGEPGIGKTTVWTTSLALGAKHGLEVLSCRPVQAEAKLALASLTDLVSPLVDTHFAKLPEPQRLTLEVALLRSTARGAFPDGRAVATATHSLLKARAADAGVLLAIDDVQWLDRSSAAALTFALRRLAESRVRVVLTARVEHGAVPDPLDVERNLSGRVDRLRLGPFSLGGLHHLLRERLGHVLPRPMLQRIGQASGGNPLLALELARALLEVGARPGPGEPLPVPDTLAALLNARLARLPGGAKEALLAAAALRRPDVDLISEALGPAAATGLEVAEQAGVIRVREGVVHFDHPLVASTLYASARPSARREVHRALGAAVEEAEERARHLALAAEGEDETVARLLEDAAEHARLRGAPDAGAELMDLALRSTANVDDRRQRTVKLANLLNAAGDTAHAEALLEQAIPGMPRGVARAEAILVYGVIVSEPAAHLRSITWCLEAIEEATDDPLLMARIHNYLAQSLGDIDQRKAADHARRAVELLEPLDAGLAYANALQALASAELLAGLPPNDAAIETAMAIEEREVQGRFGADLLFVPAFWSAFRDDLETACSRFRAYLDLAGEAGDEAVQPWLLGQLAETEFQMGRYDLAAQHAEESIALAEQIGQGDYACAMATYTRALVAAHRGELETAEATVERLEDALKEHSGERGRAFVDAVRGFARLSSGDLAGADRHYESAAATLAAINMHEPARHRFQGDQVEAAIGLGDLDRAEAMVCRLEERARVFPRPWTLAVGGRSRGLLLAARGEVDLAEHALREALVAHERLPIPFELGRTRLCLGLVLRRRGERKAARDELDAARGIFAGLGCPLWAERTDAELRRIPIRRQTPPREELTPTELQMAELAAAGRTNREVAQALFVSPKTVEVNLSRVYRKLGIRSRAELGAKMAERRGGVAAKP